jgi:hypothetical protein
MKETMQKKYDISYYAREYNGRATQWFTLKLRGTEKVASIFVTDATTGELLKHGYTTGDPFDNFTVLEGATKTASVENLVFGAAKMLFYAMEVRKLTEETVIKFPPAKGEEGYELSGVDLLNHIAYKVPRAIFELEEEEAAKEQNGGKPNFNKTDPVVAFTVRKFGAKEDESAFDALGDFDTLKSQICDFLLELVEKMKDSHPAVCKGCGRGIPWTFIQKYVDEGDFLVTAIALVRQALISNDKELARTLYCFATDYANRSNESSDFDDKWAVKVSKENKDRFKKQALQFFNAYTFWADEAYRFLNLCDGSKKLAQANALMVEMLKENIESTETNKRKRNDEATQLLEECGWVNFVNSVLATDVMSTKHTYSPEAVKVIKEIGEGNFDFNKYLS